MNKYFTRINNTNHISSWKSRGLSNESIKPPTTSDDSLAPELDYYDTKIRVKFTGCLKQSTISYTHGQIVNISIIYKLGASSSNDNDSTLKKCLFGAVTLTKILTWKSMVTLVMELGLIEDQVFHFHLVDLVKIYKFLV